MLEARKYCPWAMWFARVLSPMKRAGATELIITKAIAEMDGMGRVVVLAGRTPHFEVSGEALWLSAACSRCKTDHVSHPVSTFFVKTTQSTDNCNCLASGSFVERRRWYYCWWVQHQQSVMQSSVIENLSRILSRIECIGGSFAGQITIRPKYL